MRTSAPTQQRACAYSATRCLEAPHARAALQILDTHSDVAVIFTDVGLPGGMNGRQLAEEVRKRKPTVKILFTTGYARNAIVHDGRLDPGVELLPKRRSSPKRLSAQSCATFSTHDRRRHGLPSLRDEPLIRMLAQEYLEECGAKVEIAGSATEALNKLRLIPGGVDAMVIDMGLPDSKGDILVREVRASYPSLRIVIATGQGSDVVPVGWTVWRLR